MGGRGTRDSARLKCMFTEIVLLRLDIDWAVGCAAWQYFRWIQISFNFNGLYLRAKGFDVVKAVDESKVRMVVPARDSGMRQAMHIRSTHLLVELHKSYGRLQLHQTKQSHVATIYGFRRRSFVIHMFSSTRPGASRCVPGERFATEVVSDTRI